jgi:hypothetical protein
MFIIGTYTILLHKESANFAVNSNINYQSELDANYEKSKAS